MTAALTATHDFLSQRLRPGGIALDATAGQGHDTVFLARGLGAGGVVHACDVQPAALAATHRRWEQATGAKAALHLHLVGHEAVRTSLEEAGVTRLDAIMFNLGYLPGGGREVTTRTATTMAALRALLPLLAPGGVLTVVGYPGHPGGLEELAEVLVWAAGLPPATYLARHLRLLNIGPLRPELVALESSANGRHP